MWFIESATVSLIGPKVNFAAYVKRPKAEKLSASGDFAPDLLTRGSLSGPRWGLPIRPDYVTLCGFPLIPGSGRYVG